MKEIALYRWTAFTGILLFTLVIGEIPLYFTYTPTPSGTPPPHIIFYRIIIDFFICIGLFGFFSGFKQIINRSFPQYDWLASFIYTNAIAFSIASLIADSIQAGSVWVAGNNPVNPTFVGYGAEGALLIYGPINRLLMATILIATGVVIAKTGIVSKWIAWLNFIVALYNLAFIPTIFYMTTPLDFYSTNGWNIPIAAGYFFLCLLIMGIALLRNKPAHK